MIPFVIVRTAKGSAYLRPERVIAINATDDEECIVLMSDGVTIVAKEAAEDIVARVEAEARQEDAASARGV